MKNVRFLLLSLMALCFVLPSMAQDKSQETSLVELPDSVILQMLHERPERPVMKTPQSDKVVSTEVKAELNKYKKFSDNRYSLTITREEAVDLGIAAKDYDYVMGMIGFVNNEIECVIKAGGRVVMAEPDTVVCVEKDSISQITI